MIVENEARIKKQKEEQEKRLDKIRKEMGGRDDFSSNLVEAYALLDLPYQLKEEPASNINDAPKPTDVEKHDKSHSEKSDKEKEIDNQEEND